MTLAEVAAVAGGSVTDADADVTVTGGAFLDTRTPEPGGLFVAFAGEHVDGHDFAASAVGAGAVAVLGSRPTGVPTVVVPDTQAALQELARVVLARLRQDGPVPGSGSMSVVAVTGSQGKTSAKDMLAGVLASAGPTGPTAGTVATRGSFNNELGLPLTVLRATPGTRALVLEMGARGIGHLADLCRVAPPDVSLVLNVGKAHLGEFGSQDAIARAKGEIVDALTAAGTAVLNADDARVSAMAARSRGPVLTFGRAEHADVRLADPVLDDLGRASFTLRHAGRTEPVALRVIGGHHAVNAAAAAAVALAVGRDLGDVAASLAALPALSRWRMELSDRADGLSVLNDAYNANPDSMRAGLETLAGIGERTGRRTVAVLGEMRELGSDATDEHAEIGRLARALGVDALLVVGDGARGIGDGWAAAGAPAAAYAPSVDEALTWLRDNVAGPDVVLVKASRAAALERVAAGLLAEGGTTA